jgi:N-acyl-D-amino-acid deacylase
MARERGVDPVALARSLMPGGAVYFAMSDEDVERILAHPLTMIGSDGLPGDGVPHPRLWGSFPRVLGRYVRERRLLALEAAVHKMTGLTARRFGLAGRGLVAPGAAADLTLFDPERVIDRADYRDPLAAPEGIAWVLVNGRVAVEGGALADDRAGRVLVRRT